jgi:hypothetical protein
MPRDFCLARPATADVMMIAKGSPPAFRQCACPLSCGFELIVDKAPAVPHPACPAIQVAAIWALAAGMIATRGMYGYQGLQPNGNNNESLDGVALFRTGLTLET